MTLRTRRGRRLSFEPETTTTTTGKTTTATHFPTNFGRTDPIKNDCEPLLFIHQPGSHSGPQAHRVDRGTISSHVQRTLHWRRRRQARLTLDPILWKVDHISDSGQVSGVESCFDSLSWNENAYAFVQDDGGSAREETAVKQQGDGRQRRRDYLQDECRPTQHGQRRPTSGDNDNDNDNDSSSNRKNKSNSPSSTQMKDILFLALCASREPELRTSKPETIQAALLHFLTILLPGIFTIPEETIVHGNWALQVAQESPEVLYGILAIGVASFLAINGRDGGSGTSSETKGGRIPEGGSRERGGGCSSSSSSSSSPLSSFSSCSSYSPSTLGSSSITTPLSLAGVAIDDGYIPTRTTADCDDDDESGDFKDHNISKSSKSNTRDSSDVPISESDALIFLSRAVREIRRRLAHEDIASLDIAAIATATTCDIDNDTDIDDHISHLDRLIYSVLCVSCATTLLGSPDETRIHMTGLSKLLKLRESLLLTPGDNCATQGGSRLPDHCWHHFLTFAGLLEEGQFQFRFGSGGSSSLSPVATETPPWW